MQMIFLRLVHLPKRTYVVLMLLVSVLYATDAETQSEVQSQPNVLSPTSSLHKADAVASFRLSIEQFNELPCSDCDGLTMDDISGNGKLDLLLSNGKGGETFWYEQGDAPEKWTRHPIFRVPAAGREIEGNDWVTLTVMVSSKRYRSTSETASSTCTLMTVTRAVNGRPLHFRPTVRFYNPRWSPMSTRMDGLI